jgi:hypothetical protein
MKSKNQFGRIATIILAIALGMIFARYAFKNLIYDHGTVDKVSILGKIYHKAGSNIETTFTNSLIQTFPFEGKIDWKLQFIKDPMIILTGKVDTNTLNHFVTNNSSTQFVWSGIDNKGQNWSADGWPSPEEYPAVIWNSMIFKVEGVGQYPPVIEGSVEFSSGKAVIKSY